LHITLCTSSSTPKPPRPWSCLLQTDKRREARAGRLPAIPTKNRVRTMNRGWVRYFCPDLQPQMQLRTLPLSDKPSNSPEVAFEPICMPWMTQRERNGVRTRFLCPFGGFIRVQPDTPVWSTVPRPAGQVSVSGNTPPLRLQVPSRRELVKRNQPLTLNTVDRVSAFLYSIFASLSAEPDSRSRDRT